MSCFLSSPFFLSHTLTVHAFSRVQVLQQFLPIHHMFSALFFSSMGMMVDPMVLAEHSVGILVIVIAVFLFKSVSIYLGLNLYLSMSSTIVSTSLQNEAATPENQVHPPGIPRTHLSASERQECVYFSIYSTANIGELLFVLASEGRLAGVLDKILYYFLIGSAAVSISLVPLLLNMMPLVRKFWAQQRAVDLHGRYYDARTKS